MGFSGSCCLFSHVRQYLLYVCIWREVNYENETGGLLFHLLGEVGCNSVIHTVTRMQSIYHSGIILNLIGGYFILFYLIE